MKSQLTPIVATLIKPRFGQIKVSQNIGMAAALIKTELPSIVKQMPKNLAEVIAYQREMRMLMKD